MRIRTPSAPLQELAGQASSCLKIKNSSSSAQRHARAFSQGHPGAARDPLQSWPAACKLARGRLAHRRRGDGRAAVRPPDSAHRRRNGLYGRAGGPARQPVGDRAGFAAPAMFAGLTGTCGLTKVLEVLPWNTENPAPPGRRPHLAAPGPRRRPAAPARQRQTNPIQIIRGPASLARVTKVSLPESFKRRRRERGEMMTKHDPAVSVEDEKVVQRTRLGRMGQPELAGHDVIRV